MALRVLTNAERQQLQGNSKFLEESKWAIRNFASFWADDADLAAKISAAGSNQTWAKNRIFAVSILRDDVQDPDVALDFTVLSKGMELYDPVADPSFTADEIVTYMISQNKFDELAALYVAQKIKDIPF